MPAKLVVIGGGDSAVEAVMGLAAQDGCEVTLSYRKPELLRIKQRNAQRIEKFIQEGRVKFLGETAVTSIEMNRVALQGPTGPVIFTLDWRKLPQ